MREGWQIKELGEIADIEYGFTDKATTEGDFRYIRITDIDAEGLLSDKEKVYINSTPDCQNFILSNNNLLMARTGATFAKVLLFDGDEPSVFASYLIRIKFNGIVDHKFYWYFSKSKIYWEQANLLSSGAAQPQFNGNALKQVIFTFPKSLPEQQRIVAILDECFAALEKAKANAEQNLKNAKELFESYLQGVFESSNYGYLEFGEICELVGGSQPSKEQFIYEPLEGYIRLIQVRDYRTEKFITYIPKSSAKRFCNKDDIMIGRYGPPIFGIFKGLEGAYNVALIKAIVNESLCDKDYFYWFLKNTKLREFVEQSSKRAVGQDGIRKELLEKYPVPLPPLPEQQTIVRQLDSLRAETQRLEAVYQQKLADLEELKKSILQKAFSGELTDKSIAS